VSVRLFAALDLPAGVREGLAGWARTCVGSHEGLRLVAAESLHVTLCFLGARPVEEVESIGRIVRDVASRAGGAPPLAVGLPAWLPPRRPRVLAVDLEDREGAVGRLQGALAAALAHGAGYEPARRAYRPHVTVARVRGHARVDAGELPPPGPVEFDGAAVTLYRSRPQCGGSRYEALARVGLAR
jgi:2'-5' RNA ligase